MMYTNQSERIKELENALNGIIEGCENIKEDYGRSNKAMYSFAQCIIRDCNRALEGLAYEQL